MATRTRIGFEKGSVIVGTEYSGYQAAIGEISAAPDGIGKAFRVAPGGLADGFIRFANTPEDGPFYAKVAVTIMAAPTSGDELCYMAENGVETRIGVVLDPDRTLYLHEGGPGFATIGERSNPLEIGRRYTIELGYTNNPALGTTKIEARIDGVMFASATLTGTAGQVDMFGWGWLNPDATVDIYFDDVVVNDGLDLGDGNETWPGQSRLAMWVPEGLDALGNSGWTRGGLDLGSDFAQVAPTDPDWDDTTHTWDEEDDDTYLTAVANDATIDFTVSSPYSIGVGDGDYIKGISAQVRWAMATGPGLSQIELYIRPGSNLTKNSVTITNEDTPFRNGNGEVSSNDPISTSYIPGSTTRWTTRDLSSLRVGMRSVDANPDIYVSALWGYIEYAPNYTFGGDPIYLPDSAPNYELIIAGVDRTNDLEFQTLTIDDIINEQANTASFGMSDLHDLGAPSEGQLVQIFVNDIKFFSGYVTEAKYNTIGPGVDRYDIDCIDHTRDLDRRRIAATYQNLTDKEIIERMASDFAFDDGITTNNVSEGILIPSISFNYITFTAAMKKICERTGRNWFIDYDKDIHYFPLTQTRAPFDITDNTAKQSNLTLTKNATNLKNRIFVRGGTELSAEFTETQVADGTQRQFLLADKAHEFSMTEGGVAKTVGIKNIDDPADFDYLLNFQEKYVECGSGTTTPAASTEMAFSYKYDVPVLVSVEDTASIAEQATLSGGSGVFEYVITDKNISTTQEARDRAAAELADYGRSIVEGSFRTMYAGFSSGQYMHIKQTSKGVDDDYLINRVRLTSISGGRFETTVQLTSAKSLGIITFLIGLLNAGRANEDFNAEEVIDQILGATDTLDSLTDNLVDSMGGTASKWSNDAGTTTNKFIYNLSQWQ